MYEIRIITNGGEKGLDLSKPSFPFNFESNDIAQLNDSTASWSYTIQLPRTAKNNRLLGFAGTRYVRSSVPYARLSCNVYVDGIQIINRGVMYIDTITQTEFNTQILAGTADVFELMKDVDFKTWNKTTITLPTTSQPTNTTPATGTVHSYALNLYADNLCRIKNGTKEDDFYMYATPLLRVGNASDQGTLKNLLTQIGYSLVTDTSSTVLDKLWLTMATRKKASGSNSYMWKSSDSNIGTSNVITNNGKSRRGKTRFSCTFTSRNDFYNTHHSRVTLGSAFASFQSAGGSCYLIFYDQNNTELARVSINDFVVSDSASTLSASVTIDGSVAYASFHTFGGTSETEWSGYDGSGYYTYTGMHITSYKWRVETLPAEESDNAISGQRLNLEANCGIANGMDFFKILSQAFGWTVKIDPIAKVIYAYSFTYIKNRKEYAPDWTRKVAEDIDYELDYDFGSYARENVIKLQENKLSGYKDEASFTIPNENLKPSTNLLDIKTSSGGHADTAEQWERQDDGSYKWKDSGAPHLIVWNSSELRHMTAANILTNYAAVVDTLQEVMTVKLKMLLSVVDILNYDQFTPVYLRQYGAYFYVNKISNWEAGKLCDVELLRL